MRKIRRCWSRAACVFLAFLSAVAGCMCTEHRVVADNISGEGVVERVVDEGEDKEGKRRTVVLVADREQLRRHGVTEEEAFVAALELLRRQAAAGLAFKLGDVLGWDEAGPKETSEFLAPEHLLANERLRKFLEEGLDVETRVEQGEGRGFRVLWSHRIQLPVVGQ